MGLAENLRSGVGLFSPLDNSELLENAQASYQNGLHHVVNGQRLLSRVLGVARGEIIYRGQYDPTIYRTAGVPGRRKGDQSIHDSQFAWICDGSFFIRMPQRCASLYSTDIFDLAVTHQVTAFSDIDDYFRAELHAVVMCVQTFDGASANEQRPVRQGVIYFDGPEVAYSRRPTDFDPVPGTLERMALFTQGENNKGWVSGAGDAIGLWPDSTPAALKIKDRDPGVALELTL